MIRPLAGALIGVLSLTGLNASAQPAVLAANFEPLISRLQAAVLASDIDAYVGLLTDTTDTDAASKFARDAFRPNVDAAVVQARFLLPLADAPEGTGYELTVEVFTEHGIQGRLQTWRLDVTRAIGADGTPRWGITDQRYVDPVIDGLLHLSLNPHVRYDAANLVIAGEDMTLRMSRGTVFVAETASGGVTGLVLLGDGRLTFSPEPEAERGQIRILTGRESLEAEFSSAFVRIHPEMFGSRVSTGTLVEQPGGRDDFERAQELFDRFASLSFAVDLSDLSDKTWWLTPGVGDFIAEVETRRYGTLTYSQSQNQPEDISVFERETRRIISLYPSARKRAVQGRYYSDNDAVSYDVLDYHVDATFTPRGVTQESIRSRRRLRGCFIEGTARLVVRVTGLNLSTLTLRLADALDVHSVVSNEFGPMLFLRMRGQNNVVVSLPWEAAIGTEFTVEVTYSGLLPAQELDENWIGRRRLVYEGESPFGFATPRYIYSNSSYWYPQAIVSDYATATMDLTVPHDYAVVASGDPDEGNPRAGAEPNVGDDEGVRRYRFFTIQPARYLSCIISQFAADEVETRDVTIDRARMETPGPRRGVSYDSVSLAVVSNERSHDRVAGYYEDAADILRFYGTLLGDVPYPTFTLALTDAILPGGHSPAYFAVLNQQLPVHSGRMLSWRTDPVAFSGYPLFFLAHELGHQWWGQAVGWKNYHEQWLSEGLAQYFAALYAEHRDGPAVFADVLAQMQRWSLRHSDRGPVYLGNRLGQVDDEPRVFRALVYNKGAMVLHMLRRTLGDDVFFDGLRRFYDSSRFAKAGTDDLIRAFEAESGRSLTDFFERWIHEAALPEITFTYHTDARRGGEQDDVDAVLRFEQRGTLFEVPVTVTLRYRNGEEDTLIVPITEQVTEVRVPVRGQLRDVDVNSDGAALVEIG